VSTIAVRLYTPADSAALTSLGVALVADARTMEIVHRAHETGGCWVAVGEGAIVGYLCRTKDFFGREFVHLLVVAPSARRHGVASALMAAAEDACRQDALFTSTNVSNAAMRALLAVRGYAPSGRIENLDPEDDELIFVKFLKR